MDHLFNGEDESLQRNSGDGDHDVERGSIVFKKLLRPLIAGAGVTGAVAAINRTLRESGDIPHNHLGGTRRSWTWRGYDIFVTQAGEGLPVLLVHGIYAGASSYEFRRLFPLLAQHYRVTAIDLLGCGLSEKPNLEYSPELFVEQIVDAIGELCGDHTVIVASALGAAFAIRAATRLSDALLALVAITPTGLSGVLDREFAPFHPATAVVRSPLLGEAAFNLLVSRPSIRWFMERLAYADTASVTPDVIDHYYAVGHQRGARYVPAAFIGHALDVDVARDLPFVEVPLLLVWGERAPRTNPVGNAAEFQKLAKDSTLATFAHSGMLPHEEESDAVGACIETFISEHASDPGRRREPNPA